MKRLYISLIALLQATLLSGHGFDTHTLVLLADNTWQQISTICYRALKKNVFIVSYNTTSSFQTTAPVARGGRSHANCYISFGFSESPHRSDVTCTPTQEFYNASTHQWVPAYMLKIGDTLLCAHNVTKIVAFISLIKEPLPICTLEIKRTHTFFVTQYSVLTHNMVIPLAFSVGLSIPFGAATGGTVGGFFGPPTFLIGAVIGCAIGVLAKILCNSKICTYTVDAYNANMFEQHIKQQLQTTTFNEPHVVLSPNYPATHQQNAPIESIDTHNEYTFYDNKSEPLFSTSIQNPLPTIIGCGDTEPVAPLQLPGKPETPLAPEQNSGYPGVPLVPDKPIGGYALPFKKPEPLINVPVKTDLRDSVNTKDNKSDKLPKVKQYDGPEYASTGSWIKNYPLPEEAKKAFEETKLGMQGKRAYRLKNKISAFTGISEGEYVVVDAAHKNHLEVYNKHKEWSHVANFDGTKNVEKTKQGEKKPRQELKPL